MDFVEAMKAAEAGLSTWREKPHNAKWWSRIDGTPIPNDLLVNIAEAVRDASQRSMDFAGQWYAGAAAPAGSYLCLAVPTGGSPASDGQIMWMPLHREHARAALAGLMVYPIANLPAEKAKQ
jgi:hypothetical protein